MNRPIRVLELVNGYAVEGPLGGAERFVIEMTTGLDKALMQPQVFGLWDWGSPHQEKWRQMLISAGIPAHEGPAKDDLSPYHNFLAALRAIRQAVAGPVDIIHSHSEFGDAAALWLRRALRARAVIRTVHNEREWPKRPERRLLLTHLLYPLAFDAELAVSQRAAANLDARPLARWLGRRATVMYNALNFARFEQAGAWRGDRMRQTRQRQELGIPAAAPVVGTVGRLAPQKGYTYLLAAAQQVLVENPAVHFAIAGSGDLAAELQQQAASLGIVANVHFLGARSDIEALFALMDLFVSSSLWEGLPTTILEAMAAGVPVVATRVSGTVELVEHGLTGLLVEPQAAPALADAILTALATPQAMAKMAARAGATVRSRFDIRHVVQQHMALYARLAGGEKA